MNQLLYGRSYAALLIVAATALTASAQNKDWTMMPADIAFRQATIISEGTRMAAEVYAPKQPATEKLPTIVMSHGWGGVAAQLRGDAMTFARAGYLVVIFDYRGWGASDSRVFLTGPQPAERSKDLRFTAEVQEVREVVDPLDMTTDLANAVNWVWGEPQCDREKIGLWGSSYSGGHVVYVAARDPRVKATVSQVPAFDSRWVLLGDEALKTYQEATDRAHGKLGYPAPGLKVIGNLRGAPVREKLMQYAPVEDAARASQCAMLFILAEKEELFDNKDHGLKAFERATGPKKLVTIPDITHYGVYLQAKKQAQQDAFAWYDANLKGAQQ